MGSLYKINVTAGFDHQLNQYLLLFTNTYFIFATVDDDLTNQNKSNDKDKDTDEAFKDVPESEDDFIEN